MKNLIKLFVLTLGVLFFFGCEEERFIDHPGNLVPKTVIENPALPSIIVSDAKLHSEAFGHPDSALIVVLHGGPGSDYRYLLNCKDLADHGYRVVFYDQRGTGLSQRFLKSYYTNKGLSALEQVYEDLAGVIAHYKTSPTQKVFLLGQSWGGMLGIAYTGKFPNSVDGLVVCEPGGLKWDDVVEYVKSSRDFSITGESLNDVTYLDQFITAYGNQHEILDYKMAMMASTNDVTGDHATKPESYWRHGAVVNSAYYELAQKYKPDFSQGIENYNKKVLFFYSEKNKAYTDTWAKKISGALNNPELVKVNGVGHVGAFTEDNVWKQTTLPKVLAYFNSHK